MKDQKRTLIFLLVLILMMTFVSPITFRAISAETVDSYPVSDEGSVKSYV